MAGRSAGFQLLISRNDWSISRNLIYDRPEAERSSADVPLIIPRYKTAERFAVLAGFFWPARPPISSGFDTLMS